MPKPYYKKPCGVRDFCSRYLEKYNLPPPSNRIKGVINYDGKDWMMIRCFWVKDSKFCSGYIKLKVPITHLIRDTEWAVGQMSLEFMGEVRARETYFDFISMERILKSWISRDCPEIKFSWKRGGEFRTDLRSTQPPKSINFYFAMTLRFLPILQVLGRYLNTFKE